MLSLEYPVGIAAFSRAVPGTGSFPAVGRGITLSGKAGFQRERLPRQCAQRVPMSGTGGTLGPVGVLPSDAWKHDTTSKFTIMTRLAAANGGPSGSHPAREPV